MVSISKGRGYVMIFMRRVRLGSRNRETCLSECIWMRAHTYAHERNHLPTAPHTYIKLVTFLNLIAENVALGKPSSMSSRIDGPVNFKEYSCLVVDGIIEPIFRSPNDTDNPNCVVTKRGDKNPFWEVDLMAIYTVTHITYSVPADRKLLFTTFHLALYMIIQERNQLHGNQ